MSSLDHNKVKEIIKKIFDSDKIGDFVPFPSSVNTLLQFEIKNEKYMIKILTLPTLSEWENHRLDKEGKLLDFFFKHNSLKVPVPEIIHIENNDELIGYRFIIYRFVDGIVLWSVWRDLSKEEQIRLVKELASIVKEIHSVKYDWFGEIEDIEEVSRHSSYKESTLNWIQELKDSINKKKSLPMDLLEKAQKFIQNNIDKVTYKPVPTLVHNDIHQANVVVKKNDQGNYKIQAIVDWEWACSANLLDDLFWIKDTVLTDKELESTFFLEYFQGERDNLDDFVIDRKISNICLGLDTAASIWDTHHPPTDEEVEEVKRSLEENSKE